MHLQKAEKIAKIIEKFQSIKCLGFSNLKCEKYHLISGILHIFINLKTNEKYKWMLNKRDVCTKNGRKRCFKLI